MVKPGFVRVDIVTSLNTPRDGQLTVGESYIQFVSGKRRAPYVKPMALGKLLRRVAYTNNNTPRTFSHLLKLLGPRPTLKTHNRGCQFP